MPAILSRRAILARTATAIAAGLPTSRSWAQPRKFPSQPIQFISSSSSGSAIDILSRRVSEHFTKVLGASFVTNITGGGGVIATDRLIASQADGHTLQVIPPSHIIIPLVNPSVKYNALTQVTPICGINTGCSILVARRSLEFMTVADMVRYAKAQPGKLNFGSPGFGTASDLQGRMVQHIAGIQAENVIYKGSGPLMTDMIAGHVDVGMFSLSAVATHLRNGSLIGLGITKPKPLASLPGVPSLLEVLPSYSFPSWFALIGPAGMPVDVVAAITQAVNTLQGEPGFQRTVAEEGGNVWKAGSQELLARMEADTRQLAAFIKAANVKYQ